MGALLKKTLKNKFRLKIIFSVVQNEDIFNSWPSATSFSLKAEWWALFWCHGGAVIKLLIMTNDIKFIWSIYYHAFMSVLLPALGHVAFYQCASQLLYGCAAISSPRGAWPSASLRCKQWGGNVSGFLLRRWLGEKQQWGCTSLRKFLTLP